MKIINVVLISACFVVMCASLVQGQQTEQLNASVIADAGVPNPSSTATSTPAATGEPTATQSGSVAGGGRSADGGWHLAVSPYLWLLGVHGTIGAFGRDASFKASAGDLLSHFRFGLMGAGEARRGRILSTMDLIYSRLGDDKAIPFPGLLSPSANLIANAVIFTPKAGIRVIDQQTVKADFLAGIRYWHFGESLSFTSSLLGLNFSKSQNFVDPLVGGRIETAITRKTAVTLAGDVGGWGAASQLEYQVVGLLGYRIKPKMTLQGGYRYLYVDYLKGGQAGAVVKTAMSGVMLGVTMNLKGGDR